MSVEKRPRKPKETDAPSKTSSEVHRVPTTVRVSRSVNVSGEDTASDSEDEEVVEIHQFATTPAVIHFSYPIKRAIHFQSVGLEVGVSLPCYVEELDEGFNKAKQLVVSRMAQCMEEVDKVLEHLVELKRQSESH